MVGTEGEKLQAIRTGLERPRRRGRNADGVQRNDVEDLVVELDSSAPAENDVDLLGVGMAMCEWAALAREHAKERDTGALSSQGFARNPCFPMVAPTPSRGDVVDRGQADFREGFRHKTPSLGGCRIIASGAPDDGRCASRCILAPVTAFVTAGGGFLLAVLWFDLMFDVQTLGHGEDELPDEALASIAGYYARVTTAARPMNRLISVVMLATVAAIVAQIAGGDQPRWVGWTALALAASAIALAAARTVPSAVRLGSRKDPIEVQRRLARSICRDHLSCLAAIAALLAVELAFGT